MMSTNSNASGSDNSSTISEFFRRRISGEVPIFGGDVRTGMTEFGMSVSHSATTQLTRTLENIAATLQKMEASSRSLGDDESPIEMYDAESRDTLMILPVEGSQRAVATLDQEKLEEVVTESLVTRDDVDKYRTLLRITTTIKPDKSSSKRMRSDTMPVVKNAVTITDEQVELVIPSEQKANIFNLANKLGVTQNDHIQMLNRAVVHSSALMGQNANRTLAAAGSSALNLMLRERAASHDKSVGDTTILTQLYQNKSKLKDVAMSAELDKCVVALSNVDVRSAKVLSTVLLAIYGVIYVVGGIDMVHKVNVEHIRVYDFDTIFSNG